GGARPDYRGGNRSVGDGSEKETEHDVDHRHARHSKREAYFGSAGGFGRRQRGRAGNIRGPGKKPTSNGEAILTGPEIMKQSIRLGAFVLISLAILALFVFLVGSTESKFQSNDRLQAQFQNVSGLEEGADVRIGGLRKGTVRKIVLPSSADGKMTV